MGKLTSILAAGALITSPEAMADQPNERKDLQGEVVDAQAEQLRERVDHALAEKEEDAMTLDQVLSIDLATAIPEIFGDLTPEEIVEYAQDKIDVLKKAEQTLDKEDPRLPKVKRLVAQFERMQIEAKNILTTTLVRFGYTAEQVALLEKEFGIEGLQKAMLLGERDSGLVITLGTLAKIRADEEKYGKMLPRALEKVKAELEPDAEMTIEEIAARDVRLAQLQAENARLDAENEAIANRIVAMFDPNQK